MENWGLVTYRESRLLIDPKESSSSNKQTVAVIVGHELAHQWFGNLVTMEWWTHLWLNEGYASFIPLLCVDDQFPDYDIWTQFVTTTFNRALELDALDSSHPVEVPIKNPDDLFEIFDAISYNKGASIIRMLHDYIGDGDFRKGMHLYLTRHQYGNTFTEDLWRALEEASGKPISKIMPTWTKQLGYPLISVYYKNTETETILTLTQEKFTINGLKNHQETIWKIPITITTSSNKTTKILLETSSTQVKMPKFKANDWVKINPGSIGFYRTKYPSDMLEKFIPSIENKSLPPLDRLGIVEDLFAMVQAGHSSTVEVLKLLKAFKNETNYNVWASVCNILGRLGKVLAYTDCSNQFEKYQQDLFSTIQNTLGWNPKPNEKHLDTLLRCLILERLVLINEKNAIKEARTRYINHFKSKEVLPADLRSICYKAEISNGDKNAFNSLLEFYRASDMQEEKDRMIEALGATRDECLLRYLLEFSMSDEVKPQDMPFAILSVASSKKGRDLAWTFFKENSSKITSKTSNVLLTRLVKVMTENFATREMARDVEEFFKVNKVPGIEKSVQQAVEKIKLNAYWLERDAEIIEEFLGVRD